MNGSRHPLLQPLTSVISTPLHQLRSLRFTGTQPPLWVGWLLGRNGRLREVRYSEIRDGDTVALPRPLGRSNQGISATHTPHTFSEDQLALFAPSLFSVRLLYLPGTSCGFLPDENGMHTSPGGRGFPVHWSGNTDMFTGRQPLTTEEKAGSQPSNVWQTTLRPTPLAVKCSKTAQIPGTLSPQRPMLACHCFLRVSGLLGEERLGSVSCHTTYPRTPCERDENLSIRWRSERI